MRLLAALMAGMFFTVAMLCCMEYIRRSRVGVSQRMRRYVAGIAPVDLQPEERLTLHQRLRLHWARTRPAAAVQGPPRRTGGVPLGG